MFPSLSLSLSLSLAPPSNRVQPHMCSRCTRLFDGLLPAPKSMGGQQQAGKEQTLEKHKADEYEQIGITRVRVRAPERQFFSVSELLAANS